MIYIVRIAALTGFLWLALFFVAASVKRQELSYKLGMVSLTGMGIWAAGWLVYAGWWVSRHLCY